MANNASDDEQAVPVLRDGVGALLRDARIAKRLELGAVAGCLNIKRAFLEAIEEDRHDVLPAAVYALGFVRSYAEFLGLDSKEIVSRFKDGYTTVPVLEDAAGFAIPVPERGMPGVKLSIAAAVVCGLAYLGWAVLGQQGGLLVQDLPPRLIGMVKAVFVKTPPGSSDAEPQRALPVKPPTSDGGQTPQLSAMGERHATGVDTNARSPELGPSAKEDGIVSSAKASAAKSLVAPLELLVTAHPVPLLESALDDRRRYPAATNDAPRIELRALGRTWIEVRTPEGILVSRLLEGGASYWVPNRADLTLTVGNAGGLEIIVDGHPIPRLGEMGEVVRGVALDFAALKRRAQQVSN